MISSRVVTYSLQWFRSFVYKTAKSSSSSTQEKAMTPVGNKPNHHP
jgi:hypothetical protein